MQPVMAALIFACTVSMAFALSEIGSFQDSTHLLQPRYVAIDGNYIYVTAHRRLAVIEVIDPTNPHIVGKIDDGTNLPDASGRKVAVKGNYAYVATSYGLTVINVQYPDNPQFETRVSVGPAFGVQIAGDHAILALYMLNGLSIVNIADPTSPYAEGSITGSTNLQGAQDLAVVGNYAYVLATVNKCFVVVDMTDKSNPSEVGAICDSSQLSSISAVVVVGSYAYVGGTGLAVVNIADPTNPTIVKFDAGSSGQMCIGMVAVDNMIYQTIGGCDDNLVKKLSVADPENPVFVQEVNVGSCNWVSGIAAAGDYLYVAKTMDYTLSVIQTATSTTSTASTTTLSTTVSSTTTATTVTTSTTTSSSTSGSSTSTSTSSTGSSTSSTTTATASISTSSTATVTTTTISISTTSTATSVTATTSTITTAAVLQLSMGGLQNTAAGLGPVGGSVGLAMIIIFSLLLTSCCCLVVWAIWSSKSAVTPETSASVGKWAFTRTMPPLEPSVP